MYNLRNMAISVFVTTLHTETPDSRFANLNGSQAYAASCVDAEFANWSDWCQATAFNTVRYSEKLLEASGISVETLT